MIPIRGYSAGGKRGSPPFRGPEPGFRVWYADISEIPIPEREAFFRSVVDADLGRSLAGARKELFLTREFAHELCKGVETEVETPREEASTVFLGRFCIVDGKLYGLHVGGNAAMVRGGMARRFFDSFELMPVDEVE
jgi:hypothetical protein